jgi:LPPG:FO 2-phospho-L-lactate transferase
MIAALAGGVGGAKLAQGFAQILSPADFSVLVNTGDDFMHLGLYISPDPDTVMYTLAGLAERERGWGRTGETWHFMESLKQLGGESWFALGDSDLAVHIERTRRLKAGETLSAVIRGLSQSLGVTHEIAPMSDDAVRTRIVTDEGMLSFQDYFVRLRCEPEVRNIVYEGAEKAHPSAGFARLMHSPALEGIVICPSNPLLSIAPILAIPKVRAWLKARPVPVVAVSPIVGGKALKGPAAKIMHELGMRVGVLGIADYYDGLIDGLVIDRSDEHLIESMSALRVFATDAVMHDDADRKRLATDVLSFMRDLSRLEQ